MVRLLTGGDGMRPNWIVARRRVSSHRNAYALACHMASRKADGLKIKAIYAASQMVFGCCE